MSKVVDGHLHLFRKVSDAYPRTTYDVMAEADREELAEKLIAAMDAAGVDHAIVVPLSKEDDYLREILQAFPGRFAGVGIFDHDRPDDVAGVEARLAVTDLQGLRFYGLDAVDDSTPDSLSCFPVLELMAERGMVVWFYGDLVQIRALDLIMERLPTLKVVLNHSAFLPDIHAEMQVDEYRRPHFDVELPPPGLPAVEAMAAAHSNLHVHFSGHYAFSRRAVPLSRSRGRRDQAAPGVRCEPDADGVRLAVDRVRAGLFRHARCGRPPAPRTSRPTSATRSGARRRSACSGSEACSGRVRAPLVDRFGDTSDADPEIVLAGGQRDPREVARVGPERGAGHDRHATLADQA